MIKKDLLNNYYKIVSDISFIYLENKELQKKYDDLISSWISKNKMKNDNVQKKNNQQPEKTNLDKKDKANKEENNSKNSESVKKEGKTKKNNGIKNKDLTKFNDKNDFKEKIKEINKNAQSKANIGKQTKQKMHQKYNQNEYDTFEFVTPEMNNNNSGDNGFLKKNYIHRKKACNKLLRILKKIYKKLLIKLHPDRCDLEGAEATCRQLVESYKENDYIYMIYLMKKTKFKIKLSVKESKFFVDFLFEELKRVQIKNKLLKKSIWELEH